LGFGIMSGVFSFVNTLSNSLGPGTVGIHGDSPQFFLNSGMCHSCGCSGFCSKGSSVLHSLASEFKWMMIYFKLFKKIYLSVCLSIYLSIYLLYMSTNTPEEGTGSHWRWLWATRWLLGIELRNSGRAVISLDPC
jgi:hypothetical protein